MADIGSERAGESLYPRVTIKFCTQCKWMLRAAYFAQELLSTFSTSLAEVALQPATGGVFQCEILYLPEQEQPATTTEPGRAGLTVQRRILWDRKVDGGFPETKELKRRVRDVIDPDRDLGHVDRHSGTKSPGTKVVDTSVTPPVTIRGTSGNEEEEVVASNRAHGTVDERRTVDPPVQLCSLVNEKGHGREKCEDCV